MEFHATTLRDAIEYLRQESHRLDAHEADPARKGVAIWIDPVIYEQVFVAGPGGEARRITVTFQDASLCDVLGFVAQMVGLVLHITESGAFLCLPQPQIPGAATPDTTILDGCLRASEGYRELGMMTESDDEIRQVLKSLDHAMSAKNWPWLEKAARALCTLYPTAVDCRIKLAYAVRQNRSLEEGLSVLREALPNLAADPALQYHLACYECQLGRVDVARGYLADAIRLVPEYCEQALRASDLALLHGELQ